MGMMIKILETSKLKIWEWRQKLPQILKNDKNWDKNIGKILKQISFQ
jgi:hypothetical protein